MCERIFFAGTCLFFKKKKKGGGRTGEHVFLISFYFEILCKTLHLPSGPGENAC